LKGASSTARLAIEEAAARQALEARHDEDRETRTARAPALWRDVTNTVSDGTVSELVLQGRLRRPGQARTAGNHDAEVATEGRASCVEGRGMLPSSASPPRQGLALPE
jgi:hypothetical protein